MTQIELEHFVTKRYTMSLYDFIKTKKQRDALFDHEIADLVNVPAWRIAKLRHRFGIKRADPFTRRFESKYGADAVREFKSLAIDIDATLEDIGAYFGFSREYARQAYRKIFGQPYTKAYQEKIENRRKQIDNKRQIARRVRRIQTVIKLMQAHGIEGKTVSKGGGVYRIQCNGYQVALKHSACPLKIENRLYYRFNNHDSHRLKDDFYICCCLIPGEKRYYVIPKNRIPRTCASIYYSPNGTSGRYEQYKDAWSRLQ
jgi:AraC-like DNA-binding protein